VSEQYDFDHHAHDLALMAVAQPLYEMIERRTRENVVHPQPNEDFDIGRLSAALSIIEGEIDPECPEFKVEQQRRCDDRLTWAMAGGLCLTHGGSQPENFVTLAMDDANAAIEFTILEYGPVVYEWRDPCWDGQIKDGRIGDERDLAYQRCKDTLGVKR
jgi:hypothetical protein